MLQNALKGAPPSLLPINHRPPPYKNISFASKGVKKRPGRRSPLDSPRKQKKEQKQELIACSLGIARAPPLPICHVAGQNNRWGQAKKSVVNRPGTSLVLVLSFRDEVPNYRVHHQIFLKFSAFFSFCVWEGFTGEVTANGGEATVPVSRLVNWKGWPRDHYRFQFGMDTSSVRIWVRPRAIWVGRTDRQIPPPPPSLSKSICQPRAIQPLFQRDGE